MLNKLHAIYSLLKNFVTVQNDKLFLFFYLTKIAQNSTVS